ncbi:hypothetical protein GBB23_05855, partial [Bifidobacterium longum]
ENRTQDTGHVSISGPQPICAKSRALSRQHGDSRLPRKNKQHAIGSLQVKSRKKAARDKARTCLNMPGPSTCDIRKQKTDTCW